MVEAAEPRPETRRIMAVGDVNPCRHLAQVLLTEDISNKGASLLNLLHGADLVVGNLEGVITSCEQKNPGQVWNLKMPPVLRSLLSPFDGFSLANNHIYDFGLKGLTDTFDNLDALSIKYCGAGRNAREAGRPAIFDLDGFRVSMIGMTDKNWHPSSFSHPGTHNWRGKKTADAIRNLRQKSDFVVAQIHQGYEFLNYPGPEEMQAAKRAIDAGADLVLGHHSHYIMGVTRRGKGAIAYGLGDFLLDKQHIPEAYREKARICAVFQFEIARHQVLDWRITPCKTDQYGWPAPVDDVLATSIDEQFQELSRMLEDEKKTLQLFRNQASKNMLPYALGLLKYLFTRKGLRAMLIRLLRVRWVDINVMGHYCRRFVKRKI